MKNEKASRAMEYLDEELIAGAIDDSDLGVERKKLIIGGRKNMNKNMNWKKLVALAAMFAIIFSGGILIWQSAGSNSSGAIIALDVNPSIELEVNGKEKVVEARALNEDAETVLGTMDLKKVDLEVAVNAIIGSMVKNGYLSTEQNSILISVDSKNEAKAAELKDKISGEINTLLGNSEIEASVITQDFEKNDDNSRMAKEKDISPAKAALISRIVEAELLDSNGIPYTYDTLAKMNVNELKLIIESRDAKVDGIKSSGVASNSKYITKDDALTKALDDAQLAKEAIDRLKIEIDYDGDRRAMVYEIEFISGEKKYEYEVNANTGDIVDREIDIIKNDDERDDSRDDDRKEEQSGKNEKLLSREEALEKVYADAGVKASDVRRPEMELEREGKKDIYEIEFKYGGKEYEYKVDAQTGEILDKDIEKDD